MDFIKCSHGRRGLDRPKSGFAQPSLLPPTSAGRGRVWRDGGRPRSERGKDRGGRADIYLRGWWFPYPFPLLVLYFNLHRSPSLPSSLFHSVSLSLSFSLLPFLYLIDGVFIYLRRLFRCRCRGHTFVVVCEALNGYFRLSLSLSLSRSIISLRRERLITTTTAAAAKSGMQNDKSPRPTTAGVPLPRSGRTSVR